MPPILHMHWLWLIGVIALGIVVGWLTYLLAVTRWRDRWRDVAIAGAAIVVLLLVARVVPARYGQRIELCAILAVVGAIGCFVGWFLRDLADFVPAATRPAGPAAALADGSYLFRQALAEMGAGPAYMRATTGHAGPRRVRTVPSAASLAQAPAPGGYTFPRTPPFAGATTSRPSPAATGLRRHWSWPTR